MRPFALYCKSYRTDLRRVVRLAESIRRYNVEQIPFYVSVPREDVPLFREQLGGLPLVLLADEDILAASRPGVAEQVARMPGYLAQQVVKSEFWRLGHADAYLCLDSDAFLSGRYVKANSSPPMVVPTPCSTRRMTCSKTPCSKAASA